MEIWKKMWVSVFFWTQCIFARWQHAAHKVGPGVHLWPHFEEGEAVGGRSAMMPFERAIVVSYRLSIVAIAIAL